MRTGDIVRTESGADWVVGSTRFLPEPVDHLPAGDIAFLLRLSEGDEPHLIHRIWHGDPSAVSAMEFDLMDGVDVFGLPAMVMLDGDPCVMVSFGPDKDQELACRWFLTLEQMHGELPYRIPIRAAREDEM